MKSKKITETEKITYCPNCYFPIVSKVTKEGKVTCQQGHIVNIKEVINETTMSFMEDFQLM